MPKCALNKTGVHNPGVLEQFIVLSTLYLIAWLHREQYNLELTLINTKLETNSKRSGLVRNDALSIGAKDIRSTIASFSAMMMMIIIISKPS